MSGTARGNLVSRRQFTALALSSALIPLGTGLVSVTSPVGAAPAPRQSGTPSASPGATPAATPAATTATPKVNWSNGAKQIWRYESGSSYWVERGGITTDGGVFGVFKESGTGLEVFDAVSYERLWGFPRGGGSYSWRPETEVFFIMQGDTLIAKGPKTGEQLWTFNTQSEDFGIETNNSAGFVIAYDKGLSNNRLYLLELRSGRQIFTTAIGDAPYHAIFEADQLVLVNRYTMTLLDLPAGEKRWSFAAHDATISNWDRNTFEGKIMVVSGSTLTLLDAETGSTVWSFTATAESPSYTVDESIVYVTSGANKSALDLATGDELWRFTGTGDSVSWSIRDSIAYTTSGKILSAIDLENGAELWRYTGSDGDDLSSRVSTEGDRISVADGRTIISLDPDGGTERWQFEVPGIEKKIGSWWHAENGDIVAVSDTVVVAIDGNGGKMKWSITGDREVRTMYGYGFDERSIVIVDDTIHAIDTISADRTWSSEPFESAEWDNASQFRAGLLIVPQSRAMIIISLGDGSLRAKFNRTEQWREDEGVIYAMIGANTVAIDLTTGKTLWQTPLTAMDVSLSTSIDGYLLASNSAIAVLLDRATGALLWRTTFTPYRAWYDLLESSIVFCDVSGTFTAFGPKPVALEAGGTAVTTREITLHGAPNAKSVERATLPTGTAVTVTGVSEENGNITWWPVDTGKPGEAGWVPDDSLKATANAPAQTPPPVP